VALFYAGAYVLWLLAAFSAGAGWLFLVGSLVPAALLAWQVWTLDANEPLNPYIRFHSNRWVGFALTLALLVEWAW
jgi:4-hydroxybenzoate polyprenyltransferase